MIIIFPEFAEFSESYAPFRENPNELGLSSYVKDSNM